MTGSVADRVESVLHDTVRPALSSHVGSIRLVSVTAAGTGEPRPVVRLELTGSCSSCYFRRSCVMEVVQPAMAEALGPDVGWVVDNARI